MPEKKLPNYVVTDKLPRQIDPWRNFRTPENLLKALNEAEETAPQRHAEIQRKDP